jgi:hypothetical protein
VPLFSGILISSPDNFCVILSSFELAQNLVQWLTLILAALNHQVMVDSLVLLAGS